MEVITVEMIREAIFSFAGLSALIVLLTQIFRNWWNKDGKRWVTHLISFLTSLVCNGIVLGIGLIWKVGVYEAFNVSGWTSWLVFVASTFGMTLVANGTFTYEWVKKILEFIHLLPAKTKKYSR